MLKANSSSAAENQSEELRQKLSAYLECSKYRGQLRHHEK